MEWTIERPDAKGFYWAYSVGEEMDGLPPRVMRVYWFGEGHKVSNPDGGLWATFFFSHWMGPIAETDYNEPSPPIDAESDIT